MIINNAGIKGYINKFNKQRMIHKARAFYEEDKVCRAIYNPRLLLTL